MIIALTANALPISEMSFDSSHHTNNAEYSTNTLSLEIIKQIRVEYQPASIFDNEEQEDLFNLPRLTRLNPSLFSAEIQTSPNYVLIIEFFKPSLTAALFKNLANPPLITPWFEQLSHNNQSSRLSGWKDGNSLYSSRTTYHS